MSDSTGSCPEGDKKILFLTYFYPPDLSAGSFRAKALAKALQCLPHAGVDIEVITTQPNRYQAFAPEAEAFESEPGLRIHRVVLPRGRAGFFGQAWAFCCFARSVWKLAKKSRYDTVVATSSRLMTASLGALVAHKKGACLYLDIRDIFVETLEGVFSSVFWRPLLWGFSLLERWTLRRAGRINLVSRGFLPYFESKHPRGRYSFFSNGVDSVFAEGLRLKGHDTGLPHPLHIVYAGNIGDGQGLHAVLPRLAKALEGKAYFTVVGDGNRAQELMDALERSNVRNVKLLPPVGRDELLAFYAAADVLFLHLNDMPAFKRVLPSKIFEYAATGKPILAGVSGYAAEFVEAEISNAAVFSPCDSRAAEAGLAKLELKPVDRSGFVHRYAREQIMRRMAEDVVSCGSGA